MPIQELSLARRQFDDACASLRPALHRFCTRMTGSPCDGEDILQDVLVLAFYRISELRDGAALRPWLFRIAHNKCIDFLRGSRRFEALDEERVDDDEHTMDDRIDHKERAEHAVSALVKLPPKERACVVLKDLLDCSLEEAAAITGSNVGAVKAALHRGREKLADATPPEVQRLEPRERAVVERYLAAFNARDWEAVRALVTTDARLEVVHRTEGPFRASKYLVNYERLPWTWELALAEVDGVEVVVCFRVEDGVARPHAIVRLGVEGDAIAHVRDYVHVDYLLDDARVIRTSA